MLQYNTIIINNDGMGLLSGTCSVSNFKKKYMAASYSGEKQQP